MNSEKVKEIKKALNYCCRECDCDCPFYNNGKSYEECKSLLLFEALPLINELEECSKKWQKLCADEVALNTPLKERINELEKEKTEQLKQFAERLKEKLEEYRLENEYFIKDEPNGNLWQLNASVFCIEVTQDGGLVDETLKEFINEE